MYLGFKMYLFATLLDGNFKLRREIGIGNINGGDTAFDRSNPSYTGVAPLTRKIEGETQVYTSNANENM